ncbi:MAG TPA: DUF5996 family protein [Verrucomicrobiae bacterium]|nr:DUF5996 family protein [Verrucomicrobiae bacterium]
MSKLPPLSLRELQPTRDYLQDVAKVLGKLQQAFLPVESHDWQRGLVVNMRGLSTQPFMVASQETRASIDLVKHKVRLDGSKWLLEDYSAQEMMNNVRAWLESRGLQVHIEEPEFSESTPHFDSSQADKYATALWWMDQQLQALKTDLKTGLVSPVLLYPHHFDLSLTWFPESDERQLTVGWSTGDATIAEPYVYVTAYPEPEGFTDQQLPAPAYWNEKDFSAAILLYRDLAQAAEPEKLFASFAELLKAL